MPSIEIICVGQTQPLPHQEWPFALQSENRLISQRSPKPHFQSDFDQIQGYIYHLGSPYLRAPDAPGYYTAYELLSREHTDEWWHLIHFAPEFVDSIKTLLEQLMTASPSNQLLFTSDYQFGPAPKRYKRPIALEKFWQLHATKKLKMNALYPLKP